MMRRNCWTAALCLGLMLFGGHRLRADEPKRQWAELKEKMEAQGWTEIADGVFERRLGMNKVERLGYGREGLLWHIDQYMGRLEHLMQVYESSPSKELADLIDKLSLTLANVKQGVRDVPEELSSATAAAQYGDSCSSICYSATANAYPLTAVQGVAAVAEAKFNSACGFFGETYAEARAIATKNGTTTEVHQQDPKSGTSSTSQAVASVEGGTALGVRCESSANSWVASTVLGIAYSTEDYNNICPAPLNASIISGPTSVPFTTATCSTKNWDAAASGGVSPYTYTWYVNNSAVATGSSYPRSVCYNHADFTLKVIATDNNGATANASRVIDVSYTPVSVSMSGTSSVPFTTATCSTNTWTASAASGASPYAYTWYVDNAQVGTGSTYSRSVCHNTADFTLKVTATDSSSPVQTASATRAVDVSYTPSNPTVMINGSTYEYFARLGSCRNVTWTSTVTNGTSPYTYQWKVGTTVVGTASSYTRSVCRSQQPGFTLNLTVTDSNSATGNDTHSVVVEVEEPCECGCNGTICP